MSNSEWKQKLLDFSQIQKKSILKEIHQIVENGVYGRDYTIAPREKNKKIRADYWINDSKIKEILLSLAGKLLFIISFHVADYQMK